MNSEFKELLRLFNENHVRYLIIGGYAVLRYTEPRYTKDIDFWISVDRANAASVFLALRQFGAPLAGLTEEDFTDEGSYYQMGFPPARVDILMSIPGVDFEAAWARRETADFGGVPAFFIGKDDLILAKRAAGRPQDLIDADALEKAKD